MEYLIIAVNGCRLAIDTGRIREVCLLPEFQSVPARIPALEGIVRVRGQVLPLFSLASLLQLPEPPLNPYQHLVILQAGDRDIALRVDQAQEVVTLDIAQLRACAQVSAGLGQFSSLAETESGLILIRDPESFLDETEGAQLEQLLLEEAAGDRERARHE